MRFTDPVAETLLTPLYGRAHAETLVPKAKFHDPFAADVLRAAGHDPSTVLTDRRSAASSVWRAVLFDRLTVTFAGVHPDGRIVSAGLGLDTRQQRLGPRLPATLQWIGVDLPEVIDVRRRVVPDEAAVLVGASLAERGWAAQVPGAGRPTIVLAEGLLMYFDERGLASFLAEVRDGLGPDVELLADYFHPNVASGGKHPIEKATGARFRSGVRDGAALAAVVPGWSLLAEHPVMERISPVHHLVAVGFRALTRGGRLYSVAHLSTTHPGTGTRRWRRQARSSTCTSHRR